MAKIKLGYWKIRGLGQVARLLLNYTDAEFEDIKYENQDKWFKEDKVQLGFDFPNLPYLIEGDFKLTESLAIFKYIIERSDNKELLGKNSQDAGKVDALIYIIKEIGSSLIGLCFNPDHEKAKQEVLEKVKPKLNYIRDFIGDRQWALGYLTLADFFLAENLNYFEALFPTEHKNYGFWWRIRHNFSELPQTVSYYKRPDAMHGPFLPPMAAVQPTGPKVKLGYWGVRGLAHVNRLLLHVAGVKF